MKTIMPKKISTPAVSGGGGVPPTSSAANASAADATSPNLAGSGDATGDAASASASKSHESAASATATSRESADNSQELLKKFGQRWSTRSNKGSVGGEVQSQKDQVEGSSTKGGAGKRDKKAGAKVKQGAMAETVDAEAAGSPGVASARQLRSAKRKAGEGSDSADTKSASKGGKGKGKGKVASKVRFWCFYFYPGY